MFIYTNFIVLHFAILYFCCGNNMFKGLPNNIKNADQDGINKGFCSLVYSPHYFWLSPYKMHKMLCLQYCFVDKEILFVYLTVRNLRQALATKQAPKTFVYFHAEEQKCYCEILT